MASELKAAADFAQSVHDSLANYGETITDDLKGERWSSMAERQAMIGGLALITAGCALANAIVGAFEDLEKSNG